MPSMPSRLAAFLLLLIGLGPVLQAQAVLFQSTASQPGQASQPYLNRILNAQTHRSGNPVLPNLEAIRSDAVSVPMPDGKTRTFNLVERYRGNTGVNMWVGRSPAGEAHFQSDRMPAAEIYLAKDGPYLMAFLDAGTEQYWLESIEPALEGQQDAGLHWWSQHDPDAFPRDHSPAGEQHLERNERDVRPDPHGDPWDAPAAERAAIPDDCAIRILVAYTSGIALTDLNTLGRIETSVRRMNESNNASLVDWQVEIAVVEKVNFNPSAGVGFNTVLGYFEDPSDGIMDPIHDLRVLYDADYCQLIVENDVDGGCGLASGIGSSYSTAFCVSAIGCLAGNLTFAHEFGHLHGCKHDPYVLTLPAGKAHGYVYKPARWRTVMAYDDDCEDDGFDCTRVKHWSNPNTDSLGNPFGTPNSTNPFAATHNNAEKLNETGLTIAGNELRITDKNLLSDNTVTNAEVIQAEGVSTLRKWASADVHIQSGGRATYRAGNSITIEPGFQADAGSSFSAYLDACVSFPTSREAESDHMEEMQNLQLFPNPAQTQTRLEMRSPAGEYEGTYQLTLLDAYGRVHGQWRGEAIGGSVQHDIDLTGLPAGHYRVHLVQGGQSAEAPLQVVR